MGELVRFGVSLDSGLLKRFDALIGRRGYTNRSEAVRDLIRDELVSEDWRSGPEDAVATVTLVYDHHQLQMPRRLTEAQHDHHGLIVSSLHVHLDQRSCLEVLILRGPGRNVRRLAERLAGTRGVKHGKVTLTTTGRDLG
jgi:CopG family nickel-responsive transcriptional regulator